ncbi:MAG: hypothetical protein ACXWDO_00865 [Bacteroidia bacterium]
MAEKKINKKVAEEEGNPNVEENHELHEEHPDLGGKPGGNHEGSDTGSRGDHKKAHSGHVDSGSRTNKK